MLNIAALAGIASVYRGAGLSVLQTLFLGIWLGGTLSTWHAAGRSNAAVRRNHVTLRGVFIDTHLPWGRATGMVDAPDGVILRMDHDDDGSGAFETIWLAPGYTPPVHGTTTVSEARLRIRSAWEAARGDTPGPDRRVLSPVGVTTLLWLATLVWLFMH